MKQMLKGTEIELFTAEGVETVKNVLIGESSEDGKGYTLGIPKDDKHIWTDRKLGFFGRIFRTVGLPQQGIENNIPLQWNRNVRAELAEITGACTVYEKNTYIRHVFEDVFFHDGRGERLTKSGAVIADSVTARIYSFSHDGSYIPKAGDMIVGGASRFEFDTSSERSVSESMKGFRALYGDVIVISSAECRMNALRADIGITGR